MSTTKRSTAKTSAKKKEPAAAATAAKSRSRRAETVEEEPAEAPKKSRGRSTSATKKVVGVEAPPKPTYSLAGPIPPEGAKHPAKVGALLGVGQRALGIKEFRPGEAEAFAHLLEGQDLLAVMPTGSGKSLLYQLPSLILPGVT